MTKRLEHVDEWIDQNVPRWDIYAAGPNNKHYVHPGVWEYYSYPYNLDDEAANNPAMVAAYPHIVGVALACDTAAMLLASQHPLIQVGSLLQTAGASTYCHSLCLTPTW